LYTFFKYTILSRNPTTTYRGGSERAVAHGRVVGEPDAGDLVSYTTVFGIGERRGRRLDPRPERRSVPRHRLVPERYRSASSTPAPAASVRSAAITVV